MPRFTDNWMRFWREERGMTLQDLSDETGVSKVFLNKVERGHKVPSLRVAGRISEALDLELQEIFPPDGYPTPREVALRHFEENPPSSRGQRKRSKR